MLLIHDSDQYCYKNLKKTKNYKTWTSKQCSILQTPYNLQAAQPTFESNVGQAVQQTDKHQFVGQQCTCRYVSQKTDKPDSFQLMDTRTCCSYANEMIDFTWTKLNHFIYQNDELPRMWWIYWYDSYIYSVIVNWISR